MSTYCFVFALIVIYVFVFVMIVCDFGLGLLMVVWFFWCFWWFGFLVVDDFNVFDCFVFLLHFADSICLWILVGCLYCVNYLLWIAWRVLILLICCCYFICFGLRGLFVFDFDLWFGADLFCLLADLFFVVAWCGCLVCRLGFVCFVFWLVVWLWLIIEEMLHGVFVLCFIILKFDWCWVFKVCYV